MSENPVLKAVCREIAGSKLNAPARLFLQLLIDYPGLLAWFSVTWMNPSKKERLLKYLRSEISFPKEASGDELMRWINDENQGRMLAEEDLIQNANIEEYASRPYAGHSWNEVVQLIYERQAGRIDLATFILALEWRKWKAKTKKGSLVDAKLLLASSIYAEALFVGKKFSYGLELGKVQKLFDGIAPGNADMTKLGGCDARVYRILFFILKNPKKSYTASEILDEEKRLGIWNDKMGERSTVMTFINRYLTDNGFRTARAPRETKASPSTSRRRR